VLDFYAEEPDMRRIASRLPREQPRTAKEFGAKALFLPNQVHVAL
jgi:hypothetical protein